jgi:hypothetical protein
MNKVYITFCDDGYNGQAVDRVFDSMEKACQHVIDTQFKGNSYYKALTPGALLEHAVYQVNEHDVA